MGTVVITVEGERYQCDRSLLESSSGYFRAMFRCQLKENRSEEILVSGPCKEEITSETMGTVVKFIHSKDIHLTSDTVYDVLLSAEYFDIQSLSAYCCDFLIKTICEGFWLKTFRTAERLCLMTLMKDSLKNFMRISDRFQFQNLTFEELELILMTHFQCMKPSFVLDSIRVWLGLDFDKRITFFDDLIKYVDFKHISSKWLQNWISINGLKSNQQKLVKKLLIRLENRRLLIVGGYGKASSSVIRYCPLSNNKHQCSKPLFGCRGTSVAATANRVFVIGEIDNESLIQVGT